MTTTTSAKRTAGDKKPRTKQPPAERQPDRRAEQIILGVIVFLSAVVVVPGVLDPSMLPKLTVILVGVVALVALVAGRALVDRRVVVPQGRVLFVIGAYVVALCAVTATSSNLSVSILGVFGRWTGLVPYLAYLVLFVVVMVLGRAAVQPLLLALLGALAVVTLYGMLQVGGLDPLTSQVDGLPSIVSLFGNVNFVSGWTGAVMPLALWGALSLRERRIRLALVALLVGAALLLWQAGSTQGPIAAAAGAGLFLAIWAKARPEDAPGGVLVRRWVPILVAVGSAAALLVVGLFVATRPDGGTRQRMHFWDAALGIFGDHPLLGSGLDTYGDLFGAYRSAEGAVLYGFERTNAAHSVPLGMLSNGGILLGAAYLALVAFTAVALVAGLRRLRGDDRLLLAAFGAVWLGYQVQSLVSFDVPPVALLHYVSAAVIVVLALGPSSRVIRLPGYRERSRRKRGRQTGPSGADIAGLGALGFVALLLVVFATRPVRADIIVGSAAPLVEEGRGLEALERFERGVELSPYEPQYRVLLARLLLAADRRDEALEGFIDAATLDPGSVQDALAAGQLGAELGQEEVAERWYREALLRDPHNPEVLTQVGRYELNAGDAEEAQRLLERAVDQVLRVDSLLLLALANEDLGETDVSAALFERVLELQPGNEEAQEGLARAEEE